MNNSIVEEQGKKNNIKEALKLQDKGIRIRKNL
mgnify:CR=1 FL=1